MSEEILKALMQLFGIIAKQDGGVAVVEREFVGKFLIQQLDGHSVQEYLLQFDKFSEDTRKKKEESEEGGPVIAEKKVRLTSVRDSVRTLGICKKINKKLTQRQKVVVLVRLFELLDANGQFSEQRMAIVDTASDVFNIDKQEHLEIKNFVTPTEDNEGSDQATLIITDEHVNKGITCKHVHSNQLHGNIIIHKVKTADLYFLRYTGNSTIYLNGISVNRNRIYLFASGSSIKVPSGKPIYYSDIAAHFLADSSVAKLSFKANNIEFKFPNGHIGLRDISIDEEQGKLVGIMGASGAGKTTLLNVLSGMNKPAGGSVLINHLNLYEDKDKLEGVIGLIPQDDLLIEELTVYQNLYYCARLCFKNKSLEEITELVQKTLTSLGLNEIGEIKVGNPMNKKISGGQRKRLNIGLELIREPSILFVDEPTSGLSSRDSENVMDLLRELSLKGKLIFVVIHQPSSDIYKMFDNIIFLDTGGYLIYYGNPVEAIMYFKKADNQINSDIGECLQCGSANPEIVFNVVESKIVDEFGEFTENRKVTPEEWRALYKREISHDEKPAVTTALEKTLHLPSWLVQYKIFFTRDMLSKISNKQYMLLNLLEAPVLAFILAFVVRYIANTDRGTYIFRENENIPAYLFMCVIVILFIGLTVSAEEIFRDRKILKRESFLNLSRSAYLMAKLGLLFILSAIQTAAFVIIGNGILELHGMFLQNWVFLFSTACLANLMGLNISATFNSAVTIYIIIPLLIIPQMVLGGAMFSYDKLNQLIGGGVLSVPLISEMMPSRWAYEGLIVNQYLNNDFDKLFYDLEKRESGYHYRQVYFYPRLMDLVADCEDELLGEEAGNAVEAEDKLALLKMEIEDDLNSMPFIEERGEVSLDFLSGLNSADFSSEVAKEAMTLLEYLRSYFSLKFNTAMMQKEYRIMEFANITGETQSYSDLRNMFHNDNITDIVRRELSQNKIGVVNGKIVQLMDPIFLDPEGSGLGLGAHFYAPRKQLFGVYFGTFGFNLSVIWSMALVLYVILYYNGFRRILDAFTRSTHG